jgi:hypothetical protein
MEQQKKESRMYVQLCSCYHHAVVEFLHILNYLHGANCLHKNARSSSLRHNFYLKDYKQFAYLTDNFCCKLQILIALISPTVNIYLLLPGINLGEYGN